MKRKLKLIAIITVAWFLLGWAVSLVLPFSGYRVIHLPGSPGNPPIAKLLVWFGDALGWPVCWLFGWLVSSYPDTFGEWVANHHYYSPSGWWDIGLEAVNSILWGVVLGLSIDAVAKRGKRKTA